MDSNKSVSTNFVISTNAELLPWIETFTMDNGIKDDGAPSSWRATRSTGLFQVSGNRLMLNQGSAEGVFETGEIGIAGNNVKVSLDVSCEGGVDSGDYVRLFRIVDGGPAVQIDSSIVGKFTGTRTLVGSNITGRRLKLRVLTKVTASDEFYYLDNLRVDALQR
jgi:hypothetical protein